MKKEFFVRNIMGGMFMKLYTVTYKGVEEGIQVEKDRFFFLSVGEEGRGRKLARLPMVDELGLQTMRTVSCPERGRISMTPFSCPICGEAYTPKNIAFRGPGFMHTVGTVEAPGVLMKASVIRTREKGTILLVPPKGEDKKALVKLAIRAGYRGSTEVKFSDNGIWILKQGLSAQGKAGAMGNHKEYLVVMDPGSSVVVQRFGRLYDTPSLVRVSWDGDNLNFETF